MMFDQNLDNSSVGDNRLVHCSKYSIDNRGIIYNLVNIHQDFPFFPDVTIDLQNNFLLDYIHRNWDNLKQNSEFKATGLHGGKKEFFTVITTKARFTKRS